MLGIQVVAPVSLCLITYGSGIYADAYNIKRLGCSAKIHCWQKDNHLAKRGCDYEPMQCRKSDHVRQLAAVTNCDNTLNDCISFIKVPALTEGKSLSHTVNRHMLHGSNAGGIHGVDTGGNQTNNDVITQGDFIKMEGNPQNGESGPSDLSGGDHAEHDLGETELGTSQALTNIVMTVQYDGGEYSGFVGPNHFYNEAKQEMLQNRGTPSVNKPKVVLKSVSNEVLRAIAIIHSYMPKGRKKKKVDSENAAENVDGTAMHDHNGEDTLPPERRFSLIASSRTDKGVHALEMACQYLSFDKEPPLNGDIDAIMDKVNRLLPDDIQVTGMIHAPRPDFHVRFHNLGKCYTYKVDLSESPNLFERKYYWQVMKDDQFRNTLMKKYNDIRKEFSFERMRQAADVIQGTHNFEGFRKKSRGNEKGINKNPICTIERVDINRDTHQPDKRFHVVVKGDRFLYKMVRGIVGHLVMVGYGIINVEDIQRILGNAEAIPEIQYAPSTGLYLTKVVFEPEVEKALAASKERRIEHLREIFRPSKVTETDMLS